MLHSTQAFSLSTNPYQCPRLWQCWGILGLENRLRPWIPMLPRLVFWVQRQNQYKNKPKRNSASSPSCLSMSPVQLLVWPLPSTKGILSFFIWLGILQSKARLGWRWGQGGTPEGDWDGVGGWDGDWEGRVENGTEVSPRYDTTPTYSYFFLFPLANYRNNTYSVWTTWKTWK